MTSASCRRRAYRWHLLMLAIAVSEVVYAVRFAVMLPRLVRETSK